MRRRLTRSFTRTWSPQPRNGASPCARDGSRHGDSMNPRASRMDRALPRSRQHTLTESLLSVSDTASSRRRALVQRDGHTALLGLGGRQRPWRVSQRQWPGAQGQLWGVNGTWRGILVLGSVPVNSLSFSSHRQRELHVPSPTLRRRPTSAKAQLRKSLPTVFLPSPQA